MAIVTVGIDLAKNVFAVHGINEFSKPQLVEPSVSRAKLPKLISQLPPCTIAMEACSGAHYWARQFQAMGHTVKLIAPKFVSPYRMGGKCGKNDAADAAAICEAATRPQMRFVAVKTIDQMSMLFNHRARQGQVQMKVALINRIRGLLHEMGIIYPKGASAAKLTAYVNSILEELPAPMQITFSHLLTQLQSVCEQIDFFAEQIAFLAKDNIQTQQLMKLPGIGVLTATALVATIGNGSQFTCGRQLAAFLGLVPRQNSSGGKARLGRITKGGDNYLRSLLIMGAKSVILNSSRKEEISSIERWALNLKERKVYGKAVIALASKNARMCWAALQRGDAFVLPK